MRVNSNKQWYEYEADKNRICAIMVYPSETNPKKYIIDLKCFKEDNTSYFQYIYDKKNKPKETCHYSCNDGSEHHFSRSKN